MMTKCNLFYGLVLLLAGCAALDVDGRHTSLAKRPIESRDFDAEVRAQNVAADNATNVAADPALTANIARFMRQSAEGRAVFGNAYAKAQAAVYAASGAMILSDPWIKAQVALGDLEGSRNKAVSALVGLDQLYINRLNTTVFRKPQGGELALDLARADALKIVDSQDDLLDRLKGMIKQP